MDAGVPGWLRGVVGVVGLLAGVVGLGLALLVLWVVLLVWNAPQVLQHNRIVTLAMLAVLVAKGLLTFWASWVLLARGGVGVGTPRVRGGRVAGPGVERLGAEPGRFARPSLGLVGSAAAGGSAALPRGRVRLGGVSRPSMALRREEHPFCLTGGVADGPAREV